MAEASQPIVTIALDDILAVNNAADVSVDLFSHFDDPSTTGLVAEFELFNTSLGGGVKEVLLFDQAGAGAPLTVANFLGYVTDGDYANTIIHRSVPGFIVQGGGFTVDNAVGTISSDPPVQNEFSPDRSNLRGTISMAKLGGDPNSATNQWFFNLGNNSANLDNQNGGFTVFGEVLSVSDLAVIDAIAAVDIFNGTSINPVFEDIPLIFDDPTNPVVTGNENFVRYSSITVEQRDELAFTISNNSNPQLLNASINGNQLVLDYLPGQVGTANITIQATNLLGQVVEDTFSVTTVDSSFDSGAYIASYDDLINAFGYDLTAGALHYGQNGLSEGRQITFEADEYIASYADLIQSLGYDLAGSAQHFINNGSKEGRLRDRFDANAYLTKYSDLRAVYGDDLGAATEHYIRFGFAEGRTWFDPGEYIASYDDLINTFGYDLAAGAQHYEQNGAAEGRQITFQADEYIASHPDLIETIRYDLEAGIRHFISFGSAEGRSRDLFDAAAYLDRYADLKAVFGNDLNAAAEHYITQGYFEGRI